ncbi:MAG TPA: GNAT family N-acetyltransferase [Geobacteraceae bacterium]
MNEQISIRNACRSDLDAVIALDDSGPLKEKRPYWRRIFDHYASPDNDDRHFLVTEMNGLVVGFIVAEVRAWEFGSPPCGWVFALSVSPEARQIGIGRRMFEEICTCLKRVGVTKVRTMVDRGDKLTSSFFHSQGMRTGRYVELEQ